MCTIYRDILSGTMDAFASVISNNLNIVMKLLTSITIMLTIPTLFASLWGMNVPVPFQNSPSGVRDRLWNFSGCIRHFRYHHVPQKNVLRKKSCVSALFYGIYVCKKLRCTCVTTSSNKDRTIGLPFPCLVSLGICTASMLLCEPWNCVIVKFSCKCTQQINTSSLPFAPSFCNAKILCPLPFLFCGSISSMGKRFA